MEGPQKEWETALAEGRFILPRAKASGTYFFPPRVTAPGIGGEWEWVEASGKGTVYSVSIVRPLPPERPYNVALIELEEGVRIMSRVDGVEPDKVMIGMPVTARIDVSGDKPALLFDPA